MSPIPPSAVSGADIEGTSHLPTRAAKEPAANVEYTSGELVAVVELHLALGTVDVVSPNVRQMVGVYRRIVRTWLEPHLWEGADQSRPCTGCDGEFSYADCPQVGFFRQVLTEYASNLLEPQS
jgi:hypothetical protein